VAQVPPQMLELQVGEMWLELQTVPQLPQLLVDCEVQTPLQTRLGDAQMQLPAWQVGASTPQTWPQVPQLLASPSVKISQPLPWRLPSQFWYPLAQLPTQALEEHAEPTTWFELQTVPQAPQLSASFKVLISQPSDWMSPLQSR
jgi:hypothetical protein